MSSVLLRALAPFAPLDPCASEQQLLFSNANGASHSDQADRLIEPIGTRLADRDISFDCLAQTDGVDPQRRRRLE